MKSYRFTLTISGEGNTQEEALRHAVAVLDGTVRGLSADVLANRLECHGRDDGLVDDDDSDGDECDECGADIPPGGTGLVNHHHKATCSLHPDNVVPAAEPLDPAADVLGDVYDAIEDAAINGDGETDIREVAFPNASPPRLVLTMADGSVWHITATKVDGGVENIPCAGCGRTDLPLHTDGRCPDCHKNDAQKQA
jgi:hypothetical protein